MLIEERMRRMERFMGLGTLAAGLHHEIKNPLSALSLHVQLLEERLEQIKDGETADILGVLKTEIIRTIGVLESFRDYASIEKLDLTATDIAALIKQTLDLIRPKAQQQGVQIVAHIPDGSPPLISVDATRMEQVLLNLAMNALDEMQEGGTLTLSVTGSDGQITLEVADTGRGIPDNVRARVFDPYFTTKNEGTGMGLAVCDKIVRQHGGQIDVTSAASGAIFRISLPVNNA
jgi:signal transduction histidine kinase